MAVLVADAATVPEAVNVAGGVRLIEGLGDLLPERVAGGEPMGWSMPITTLPLPDGAVPRPAGSA